MKEYLFHWQFWVAVVLVAFLTNWAYNRFFGGKGQLV